MNLLFVEGSAGVNLLFLNPHALPGFDSSFTASLHSFSSTHASGASAPPVHSTTEPLSPLPILTALPRAASSSHINSQRLGSHIKPSSELKGF